MLAFQTCIVNSSSTYKKIKKGRFKFKEFQKMIDDND
jgi:hypothetical protein